MDRLAPFLSDHFQRAVYSRDLDGDEGMNESIIAGEKPDIVIYECNERWLRRLLSIPIHTVQEK
jgi:hypothetical protein